MIMKSRIIYCALLSVLIMLFASCTPSDEQFIKDIKKELASEFENEIEEITSSLVNEAKSTANEKITEIKENVKDEITDYFEDEQENTMIDNRVSSSQTRQQVLQKILEEHGSLPLLPDYGDSPPSALKYQCVYWAKARRLSLNGEKLTNSTISSSGSGAKNYVNKYSNSIVKITNKNNNPSCTVIQEGSVVIFDSNLNGAGLLGHAAIIEVVQYDGIWISEQNWPYSQDSEGNPYFSGKRNKDEVRFLSWAKMIGLYIIPKDSQPD